MSDIIVSNSQELSAKEDANSNLLVPSKFEHLQRLAKCFSESDLVPAHFRGKTANCIIALQMAFRLNIDPMLALQNIYIVYGNPGLSSQLAIALANRAGVFDKPIMFREEGSGDSLSMTAYTSIKGEVATITISLAQARKAGWTRAKEGEKPTWVGSPAQMLRYRTASQLIRAYAPDVLMGMHTTEEWDDAGDQVQIVGQQHKTMLEKAVERSVSEAVIEVVHEPEQPQQAPQLPTFQRITPAEPEQPRRRGRPPQQRDAGLLKMSEPQQKPQPVEECDEVNF